MHSGMESLRNLGGQIVTNDKFFWSICCSLADFVKRMFNIYENGVPMMTKETPALNAAVEGGPSLFKPQLDCNVSKK